MDRKAVKVFAVLKENDDRTEVLVLKNLESSNELEDKVAKYAKRKRYDTVLIY